MSLRSRVPRSRVTHDRWLVSYADFITLLFGFFVVLYAFANTDKKKQADLPGAVDSAFRNLSVFHGTSWLIGSGSRNSVGADASPAVSAVMREDVLSPVRVRGDLNRIRRELEQALAVQVGTHQISIAMSREGLVISLREAGFFGSGSANPKPGTSATLRQVAASLGRTPYDIRIEGHTDNVPIHTTEFDSNWELSSARATRIARLILDLNTISPERISVAGYAEFHPAASNDTASGRAQNRRVDLVVLPRTTVDLSGTDPTPPSTEWRRVAED